MKFSGLCLVSDDVPRLARFYQQVLDIRFEINDHHVELPVDGGSFAIYSRAAAMGDMGFALDAPHAGANLVLMFNVDDVDAEYRRLQGFVDSFLSAPRTYPWGARAVHFTDPDGNVVDFVSRP